MAKQSRQKQVLVIEDERDLRQFSKWLLEAEGYFALEAADGDEGIKIAKAQKIDLILLDIRLSNVYSWTVLTEIKNTPALAGIPVVIFTASADADSKDKAKTMGAVEYLVKPVSAKTLKECVTRVLNEAPKNARTA